MNESTSALDRIRAHAAWLLEPSLATCAVGSTALFCAWQRAEQRHAVDAIGTTTARVPSPHDLDLAWSLDVDAGEALLRQHGVYEPTTAANRARGTLALRLDGERVEITTLRGSTEATATSPRARILADLACRDMTIGALAWWLAEDRVLDPHHGLEHWHLGLVAPVGCAKTRVREHPIRWLRYYRKAHTFGFQLAPAIRKLGLGPEVLDETPREAIAAEFRAVLEDTVSPGRCLAEWYEVGLLQALAPELAAQFDGRPAGPIRHHPELSQGLHLILALEWAAQRTAGLSRADRYAVLFAVLCHDLGKGRTAAHTFPSHHGHEHGGVEWIEQLCARFPALADSTVRQLAIEVSELHLVARGMRDMRPGTLAKLYDLHFRKASFPRELFALAVAADSGGRLGFAEQGEAVYARVLQDIEWLCSRCASVDAAALRLDHPDDVDAFRMALHEARARALLRA